MSFKTEEIFSLLTKKNSLPELLDLASKLLKNPVSFSNTTMEIVFVSKNYSVEDRMKRAGHLKTLNHEEYLDIVAKLDNRSDNAPFLYESGHGERQAISKTYCFGKYMGYLALLEKESKLEELDSELFKLLSDACAVALNIQSENRMPSKEQTIEQNIVENLINDNSRDLLNLKKQIEFSRLSHFSSFCVAAICPMGMSKAQVSLILQSQLESLRSANLDFWLSQGRKFVIAVFAWNADSMPQIEEVFQELVDEYKVTVGISDVFLDIIKVRNNYIRAKCAAITTVRYGRPDKVMYYNNAKVYAAITELLKHDIVLEDFCASELMTLEKYDEKNNTAYYDTLEAYLFSGKNASDTAKKLFVHKNTVNYRINRIFEIFAIDAENFDTVLRLQMSFLIKRIWKN